MGLFLHLGCGEHKLPGWQNHDRDVDLREPLPWRDGTASFVFAEHVIEHLTAPEAFRFLEQCCRVLEPKKGALRLSFPDVARVATLADEALEAYRLGLARKGVAPASGPVLSPTAALRRMRVESVRSVICDWKHQSAWTLELGVVFLKGAGFRDVSQCRYGESPFMDLRGIDGHHLAAGELAVLETTILEAVR